MKQIIIQTNRIYLFIMLVAFLCATSLQAIATENQFIFDDVGLLSEDEYLHIENQARTIYNSNSVAVYTVVVDSMPVSDEKQIGDYVWQFANEFTNKVSISDDTVLLFICMESGNRWREALAFGFVHEKLTGSRLRSIQESITPSLSNGDYYSAISSYYNLVQGYIISKKPFNYIGHGIILLISLAIATFVIIYLVRTAGGKTTVNYRTYSSNSEEILDKHDQYLHTTVITRTIPKASGGGGGGGSSRGGGGRF